MQTDRFVRLHAAPRLRVVRSVLHEPAHRPPQGPLRVKAGRKARKARRALQSGRCCAVWGYCAGRVFHSFDSSSPPPGQCHANASFLTDTSPYGWRGIRIPGGTRQTDGQETGTTGGEGRGRKTSGVPRAAPGPLSRWPVPTPERAGRRNAPLVDLLRLQLLELPRTGEPDDAGRIKSTDARQRADGGEL